MAIKAALYHRVSTLDQDKTLARQELRNAAAQRGYEIALDIEETGSGANNDRPGLLRLMDAVKRGKVAVVMVWKLDRLGRSTVDLLSNVSVMRDAGVRLICITQGIDTGDSNPMARFFLTVLSAVAELERDMIRERTRLGLAKARAAGRRPGPVPDPAGPTAAQVAALRAEGQSWTQVAAALGCSIGMARHRAGMEAR